MEVSCRPVLFRTSTPRRRNEGATPRPRDKGLASSSEHSSQSIDWSTLDGSDSLASTPLIACSPIYEVNGTMEDDEDVSPAILNDSGHYSFDLSLDSSEETFFRQVEDEALIKKNVKASKRRSKIKKDRSGDDTGYHSFDLPINSKKKRTTPEFEKTVYQEKKGRASKRKQAYQSVPVKAKPANRLTPYKLQRLQDAGQRLKEATMPNSNKNFSIEDMHNKIKSCPDVKNLLKDLVVYIEVKGRCVFTRLVEAMGGTVRKNLTKRVQLAIFKNGDRSRHQRGKKMGISFVNPVWLADSIKTGQFAPKEDYPISDKDLYEEELPLGSNRLRKKYGLTKEDDITAMVMKDIQERKNNQKGKKLEENGEGGCLQ